MDALPPVPPGATQVANQPAVDTLARLAATGDALASLMSGLPSPDVVDAEGASRLHHAWTAFWAGSEGGERRVTLLANHLRNAMRDAAALRVLDGTLDARAGQLVARAMRGPYDTPPAGIHARELVFGDTAYGAALILTDDAEPGVALLFTPEVGWEDRDSLDQVLQSARQRLLEPMDPRMSTGMDGDTFAQAQQQGSVGSRELAGPVFATLANQLIATRAMQLTQAADDFMLDRDDASAAARLADRARQIVRPESMLDIAAIDTLRSARLVEATVLERLAGVPEAVRSGWLDARDSYNESLEAAADLRNVLGLVPPLSLRAFASQALATRLKTLGIDHDPGSITVEISRLPDARAPLELLDHLIGQAPVRRVPLVDLAYENVGHFALDALRAVDANGASLRDRLGHEAVRRIVRELDLANSYQAHVDARMREGTIGTLVRQLAVSMQRERMRLEAADARLAYYLPFEPASFIEDRGERGFRWVDAALDSLTAHGRPQVEGRDVVVKQLTYKQLPLADILMFDVGAPGSVPRLVLYTPSAPDGIAFREFEDRQDAARRFLYRPSFREYLLDRLPASFAKALPNGSAREFAGDRRAAWVFGAAEGAGYTLTEEPFGEAVVSGNFLEASYDTAVTLAKQDALLFARTTADADRESLFAHPLAQLRLDSGRSLVGHVFAEVPSSLVRALHASWRLYDQVKAGDTEQAFVALAEGYTSALNLLLPPFIRGRPVAQALLRAQRGVSNVVEAGTRVARPRVVFESRYAVEAPRKPGLPDHEGIYHVDGRSYLQHDGLFYAAHYHRDYATWRLARTHGGSGHPDFTGPAVERIGGRWQFNHDVGLNGGMRRVRERFRRALRLNEGAAPEGAPAAEAAAAEAAPSPQWQAPLPAPIEHLRGEIEAVLMDNPSAALLYRHDGARVRYEMHTRSALILDPHLNPEIAALSPHQRRVFLHDLEQRFPQILERNEVLMTRGWARDTGHRIPDAAGGIDDPLVQSTDITSSAGGTSAAGPTLSASQELRWNEALATARQASRSSPRPPVAANAADEMVAAGEFVPADEWPDRVWFFSDRPHRMQAWAWNRQRGVTLGGELAPDGTQTGLRTHPVSTLPPETPTARLSDVLGMPTGQPGQRDPLGHWVQINLRDLGQSGAWDRGELGYTVRRRILPSGEYQYTIEATRPVRIPERFVQGGRRRATGQRLHIGVVPVERP